MNKSPFMVFQEFLSPKVCSEIMSYIYVKVPDQDIFGKPVKMIRYHKESQDIILPKFKNIIPNIQDYYKMNYEGLERLEFQFYPEDNKIAEEVHCTNSRYERKKWTKIHNRDLTGVLWLKDFNDKPPLDPEIEIYGGKLEFPTYNFGLTPQTGTLVIHPAGPNFIFGISPVLVGNLYQVRFHIASDGKWIFDQNDYQGNYLEWFQEYA